MRITAPELGPFLTTFARVAIAAVALAPFLLRVKHRNALSSHKCSLFILGVFNSALPFSLLCWASLHLEAGFTSLLNATTPICAAVIGLPPGAPSRVIGRAPDGQDLAVGSVAPENRKFGAVMVRPWAPASAVCRIWDDSCGAAPFVHATAPASGG